MGRMGTGEKLQEKNLESALQMSDIEWSFYRTLTSQYHCVRDATSTVAGGSGPDYI